jgi:hypothetical protein
LGVTFPNSRKIFTSHKKIIRIMAGAQPRISCRSLLQQLEILPVPCQYVLPLMNFIISNKENVQTNSSRHSIIMSNHHLDRPNANLSCFQRLHSMLTKSFTSLPPSVIVLKNNKARFKAALRKYLYTYSCFDV